MGVASSTRTERSTSGLALVEFPQANSRSTATVPWSASSRIFFKPRFAGEYLVILSLRLLTTFTSLFRYLFVHFYTNGCKMIHFGCLLIQCL